MFRQMNAYRTLATTIFTVALTLCAATARAANFSAVPAKASFTSGETVQFSIHCSEVSRVFVFRLSGDESTLVFPVHHGRDNLFRAGNPYILSLPPHHSGRYIIAAAPERLMTGRHSNAQRLDAMTEAIKNDNPQVTILHSSVHIVKKTTPLAGQQTDISPASVSQVSSALFLSPSNFTAAPEEWASVNYQSGRSGYVALYLESPSGELLLVTEKKVLSGKPYSHRFAVGEPGDWKMYLAWAKRSSMLPSISMGELPMANNTQTINFTVR